MRAVITGGAGFVGRWLVAHLAACGDDVVALGHADLDVTDPDAVEARMAELRPDAVYHLAAVAAASDARRDPVRAFEVNVLGTNRLLETLRRVAPGCTVLVPSSAQAYGDVDPAGLPLHEDRPLRPRDAYAATKAAQEHAALAFGESSGLRVVVARAFNHTGPGQPPTFVVPSLAAQILAGGPVRVGNLDAARDFTDVRDVVRAYRLLVIRGTPGAVYNVCSGQAVSIRTILSMLGEITGTVADPVVDPARVRTGEPLELRGSHERLTEATGWRPSIELRETLIDVVRTLRDGDTARARQQRSTPAQRDAPAASGTHRQIGIGTADITETDKTRVRAVLDSGRLSAGPVMGEFEQRFAELHDRRYASMCNSGTGALQLALQALKERYGWPDGTQVIVPAVTFVATVNVVLFNRLRPVLVDVDPVTYNIDPARVEAAVTERTVAIIPVHLFGQPADMTAIMSIAARHSLRVIEDSAEAAFVRHGGRPVGSFGDFGCFSTYMAHLVTTGVGGLAITDDLENATRFRSLMNHGRNPRYLRIDDDQGLADEDLLEVVRSRYDFVSLGQSFRATEMEAALGIGQLERHEEMLSARQSVAGALTAALARPELQLPTVAEGNEHAFMIYPIVCHREGLRDRLVTELERAGVETRFLLPVLGQRCYQGILEFPRGTFPVAEMLGERGFYIGCHPSMTGDDVAHIASVVDRVVGSSA